MKPFFGTAPQLVATLGFFVFSYIIFNTKSHSSSKCCVSYCSTKCDFNSFNHDTVVPAAVPTWCAKILRRWWKLLDCVNFTRCAASFAHFQLILLYHCAMTTRNASMVSGNKRKAAEISAKLKPNIPHKKIAIIRGLERLGAQTHVLGIAYEGETAEGKRDC